MKCPCKECPVLAICVGQTRIKCELLGNFLRHGRYRHSVHKKEVKFIYQKFNVAIIGYNDLTDIISFTKKEEVE